LGRNVAESEFRDQIGFLPENPYFHAFLTAREVLDFYARLSGVPARARAERIDRLLEMVHLTHAADMRLKTFSKGMLQRVGVAQALIHDPTVVFLDEPMSGLDPIGRREIREVILALRAAGKTVFMNTHILSDVEMVCDRVAIIVQGEIRRQGPIRELVGEGHDGAQIVVEGLAVDAAESLETRFDAKLHGVGDRIEIEIHRKHVEEALGVALASGASIVSTARRLPSLEDVFMDAVRESEATR
ncbi:ABC transporter ATP-binding protein, partial [Myxococcota bacterium]|nr:ABC transporter ATP-binding protein [Myxococcota bacterium]